MLHCKFKFQTFLEKSLSLCVEKFKPLSTQCKLTFSLKFIAAFNYKSLLVVQLSYGEMNLMETLHAAHLIWIVQICFKSSPSLRKERDFKSYFLSYQLLNNCLHYICNAIWSIVWWEQPIVNRDKTKQTTMDSQRIIPNGVLKCTES